MMTQRPVQPACRQGFEHINRYWDRQSGRWAAKLMPGEFYVTSDPQEIIATTLGSCVSACIRDRVSGIGGMNHFMLPLSNNSSSQWLSMATRYGSHAMEHLINEILKLGARRENLEVKLTGGGKVVKNMSDVGQSNIDFVLEYVRLESLDVVAQDLGDVHPRKVLYHPQTGQMRVKRLRSMHNDTLIVREANYVNALTTQPQTGEVELF